MSTELGDNVSATNEGIVPRTSLSPARLDTLGMFVDRLLTVDHRTRQQHLDLYEAAHDLQGGPLCLRAAQAILASLQPDRLNTCVFVTGFISPAFWSGEQDGPVGAAYLARALEGGLGVRSVVVTDEELVPEVEAACRGAGFKIFDVERALKVPKGRAVAVVPISKDPAEALAQVRGLYDQINPSCVIAIERPSANAKGEYHNLKGFNMTSLTGKTDCTFEEARRRGITTIGIADGGNELGYGALEDSVARLRPNGARCVCDCKGTVASHTAADVLVHSVVSNWGAYGVAACIAVLLNDAVVLPSETAVRRSLELASAAGADDGRLGWNDLGSDGVRLELELGVVGLLRAMVEEAIQLTNPRRTGTYGVGDGGEVDHP